MQIQNAVALVTGANRGLGLAFARALMGRGARKVYAAVRDPSKVTLPGVVPIKLDVTSADDIATAAAQCDDVNLLINNAGIADTGGFLDEGAEERMRRLMETNVFGVWRTSRAFAPTLARHGGGAIVNVLSVASWISNPLLATYAMSKSAAWSLTNGLRHELRDQATQVLGMHAGFIDTDLTKGLDAPKSSPDWVVAQTLDALERGAYEVAVDDISRAVHAGLSADPAVYLQAGTL